MVVEVIWSFLNFLNIWILTVTRQQQWGGEIQNGESSEAIIHNIHSGWIKTEEWSQENSVVKQIAILKKLVYDIKKLDNEELLNSARKNEKYFIGEMYLSDAEELAKIAKEKNLLLSIQKL